MDCIKIVLSITLVVFLCKTEARHAHLLCDKWRTNCAKYETHCIQETIPTNTTNNSTNATNEVNLQQQQQQQLQQQLQQDRTKAWSSCCNLAESTDSAPSGIYNIDSFGSFTLTQAYCDMNTTDSGWTVIQRRMFNSTENFNRTWHEYLHGFGHLETDFWYGLSKIQFLTEGEDIYEMKINFTNSDGEVITAEYSSFSLTGRFYTLLLGEHNGENTDMLGPFKGKHFTTIDSNNAGTTQANCAQVDSPGLLGGWWYTTTCLGDKGVNLNGKFSTDSSNIRRTITSTEMKIRPVGCNRSTMQHRSSSPLV